MTKKKRRPKLPPKYQDIGTPCEVLGEMVRFKKHKKSAKSIWWSIADILGVAQGRTERRLLDDGAIIEVPTTVVVMAGGSQIEVEGHQDLIAAEILKGISNLRRMGGD